MNNISQRIVHFDLKGAPWKVQYLKEVIVRAKEWGATGILYEWEDSFPYTENLLLIGSLGGSSRDGLYSKEEVKQLLQFTIDNGLEPIQLVQTLGHLEFVLKHEQLSHMRELHYYASVLCPTRLGGRDLVISMVKQVLAMQPDAKFIHIGADEAWHLNKCSECIERTNAARLGVDSLFIEHIQAIVTEIRTLYPNIQVLIWDDMMRGIREESLLESEMSRFVIPVVWHYCPVGQFALDRAMWLKYEKCFDQVWAASAFKGANGSCQMLSSVEHYVSNQEAWMQQIQQLEGINLRITAIVLTGWSRFDHYATMCELLPVSLPSLASCLKMWTGRGSGSTGVSATLPAGSWPGGQCARAVTHLHACREQCNTFLQSDVVRTWMNPWQLAHEYTNSMHLIAIANTATMLSHEVNVLIEEVSCRLTLLTGPRSVSEWIHSNVQCTADNIAATARNAHHRMHLQPSVQPTATDRSDRQS